MYDLVVVVGGGGGDDMPGSLHRILILYTLYIRRLLREDRLKPLGHMCGVLNINRTTKSAIIIVKAAKEIANIVLPAPRLWPSYIFLALIMQFTAGPFKTTQLVYH